MTVWRICTSFTLRREETWPGSWPAATELVLQGCSWGLATVFTLACLWSFAGHCLCFLAKWTAYQMVRTNKVQCQMTPGSLWVPRIWTAQGWWEGDSWTPQPYTVECLEGKVIRHSKCFLWLSHWRCLLASCNPHLFKWLQRTKHVGLAST